MDNITITAIQFGSIIADKQANFDKLKKLVENNIKPNSDILIFPELWNVGWACDKLTDSAEYIENSETVNLLSSIAKKYNTNILGGSFVQELNNKYYNTCPVINRKGELIATYNKNHLYSYYNDSEGTYITKGESPVVVNIEGVKIGLSICYDIRFPEIYRAYRKSGADIIVNMAAWPLSRAVHWDNLTRARAIENQIYMVALTQTGILQDGVKNLGHSLIYDYNGNVLDEINEKEGCISATINLEEMYDFRNKCTILKDIQESYEVICK